MFCFHEIVEEIKRRFLKKSYQGILYKFHKEKAKKLFNSKCCESMLRKVLYGLKRSSSRSLFWRNKTKFQLLQKVSHSNGFHALIPMLHNSLIILWLLRPGLNQNFRLGSMKLFVLIFCKNIVKGPRFFWGNYVTSWLRTFPTILWNSTILIRYQLIDSKFIDVLT